MEASAGSCLKIAIPWNILLNLDTSCEHRLSAIGDVCRNRYSISASQSLFRTLQSLWQHRVRQSIGHGEGSEVRNQGKTEEGGDEE